MPHRLPKKKRLTIALTQVGTQLEEHNKLMKAHATRVTKHLLRLRAKGLSGKEIAQLESAVRFPVGVPARSVHILATLVSNQRFRTQDQKIFDRYTQSQQKGILRQIKILQAHGQQTRELQEQIRALKRKRRQLKKEIK
jgi:hypothetical protein